MLICTQFDRNRNRADIRIEAFLTTRGQKNLAAMVPGGSGAQPQAPGVVGNGQAGRYNSTQNATVTNAEVDQIVNESRRAGTATPPVPPQGGLQYQQGQQQPYQARVKGQRQGV